MKLCKRYSFFLLSLERTVKVFSVCFMKLISGLYLTRNRHITNHVHSKITFIFFFLCIVCVCVCVCINIYSNFMHIIQYDTGYVSIYNNIIRKS